ncbi:MAG: GMC oxidoreductase, partial [Pseudomonadota bacterium]|nr:GMC oxidoreductase [Pseudomonadota bacterium]
DFHGSGGELRVEERRVNWEILDVWRDAAAQCGIPKIDEFNRGDNFGNAYFQMNQRKGKRWSAVRAFLDPIRERTNLTILTEASVRELIFDKDSAEITATGVKVLHAGHEHVFQANAEVILAAGAIASPQLLQLSGIGSSEALQNHGVTPRLELPGVGENLQDHLQIRTIYEVNNTVTLNQRARTPWGMAMMGLEYFLRKTGPMTMPPSQLGAFAKSDASQPSANIEWHVQPLSLDKFGSPLHRYNAITPSVCNLRPSSRGFVALRDANPDSAPLIQPNYLSTESDRAVAVAGLKMTREIMAAPALQPFTPHELKPGAHINSDDELALAAGDLGTTIFHPVGTCKMGNDSMAVVDDELRVKGVQNLRVIDASIMPTITSGNTNAPTVMIAEKGAEFLKRQHQHRS